MRVGLIALGSALVHCHGSRGRVPGRLRDFGTLAAYTVATPNNNLVLASNFTLWRHP
jgi:hypothetical protein